MYNNNCNCASVVCACPSNRAINNVLQIKYPYYIYPGAPFHGYALDPQIIKIYNTELNLLNYELENMRRNDKPILFHLTIGSPAEAYQMGSNNEQRFYKHQIMPEHLYTFARSGINVVNIIVSPDNLITPLFKVLTDDFAILDDRMYKHKTLPIITKIFRTMMPTNDETRNNKFMDRAKERNYSEMLEFDTECFRQTRTDREFTSLFYNNLKNVIDKNSVMGGVNICFSFAVFNDDSTNARFNSFTMFKEILNFYDNNIETNSNKLIFEWRFVKNNFSVEDNGGNKIFYVPFEKLVYNENNYKKNDRFMMVERDWNNGERMRVKYVLFENMLF